MRPLRCFTTAPSDCAVERPGPLPVVPFRTAGPMAGFLQIPQPWIVRAAGLRALGNLWRRQPDPVPAYRQPLLQPAAGGRQSFRCRDKTKLGLDKNGQPVDARDLFDRQLLKSIVLGIFENYYYRVHRQSRQRDCTSGRPGASHRPHDRGDGCGQAHDRTAAPRRPERHMTDVDFSPS
jgi:hypothetical protein